MLLVLAEMKKAHFSQFSVSAKMKKDFRSYPIHTMYICEYIYLNRILYALRISEAKINRQIINNAGGTTYNYVHIYMFEKYTLTYF